jgi:hypothetical protein
MTSILMQMAGTQALRREGSPVSGLHLCSDRVVLLHCLLRLLSAIFLLSYLAIESVVLRWAWLLSECSMHLFLSAILVYMSGTTSSKND